MATGHLLRRRRGIRVLRDASLRSWVQISPLSFFGVVVASFFAGHALSLVWAIALVQHVASVR